VLDSATALYFSFTKSKTKIAQTPTVTGNCAALCVSQKRPSSWNRKSKQEHSHSREYPEVNGLRRLYALRGFCYTPARGLAETKCCWHGEGVVGVASRAAGHSASGENLVVSLTWACGPPIGMKIGSSRRVRLFTVDGKGRLHSG
jgi:hypothetical protein